MVMLARLQQVTTLGLLAVATTWAIVRTLAGDILVALGGAAVIVLGYAAVLAVEMLLSRWVNRREATLPSPAMHAIAWFGECVCAARTFFWNQPFRSFAIPDRSETAQPARTGVVFVHGFVCNRGLWNPWLRRFDLLGVPFVAVNLEPVFGGIGCYTATIDAAVRRLTEATGRPPIVVAHSMGGLAVRAWLAEYGASARVQHVVTLGTPHRGTVLARFAWAPNTIQMRRDSDWLRALASGENERLYRSFTCYFSGCDNIVMPASSATLPGADNRHVEGVGHVQLASDERILRDIVLRVAPGSRLAAPTPG